MRLTRWIAVLVVALCAAQASAVFAPAAFSSLLAELTHRRDTDFGGTLTKTQKKQKAGVLKAIAAIGKSAKDLRSDVKVASATAASLAKLYPAEFGGVAGPTMFESLCINAFDGLGLAFGTQRAALEPRRAALTGTAATKFGAQLANADAALTTHSGLMPADLKGRGKALTSAANALYKAQQIADKAPPSGLDMLVDGVGWASNDAAFVTLYEGDDTLQITGVRSQANGDRELLQMYVKGVTGEGIYPLAGGPGTLLGNFHTEPSVGTQTIWDLVSGTGTLIVDTLDIPGRRVRLRFGFTGSNDVAGLKIISEAVLDVGGADVMTQPGNGFGM